MWNQLTIGYLAALIDGEGHIKTSKTEVQVSVTSTDYDIVERALKMSGIGYINGPYPLKSGKCRWNWSISDRRDLARLLLAIVPILSERKSQQALNAADYLFDHIARSRSCSECGTMFQPSSWRGAARRAKYCAPKCNKSAFNRRRREQRKSEGA